MCWDNVNVNVIVMYLFYSVFLTMCWCCFISMCVIYRYCSPLTSLRIQWFQIDSSGVRFLIEEDNLKYDLSAHNRVLTILTPSTADTGWYECKASFISTSQTFSPVAERAWLAVLGMTSLFSNYGRTTQYPIQWIDFSRLIFKMSAIFMEQLETLCFNYWTYVHIYLYESIVTKFGFLIVFLTNCYSLF